MGLLEWDPDMFAQLSGVYCVCVCVGGGSSPLFKSCPILLLGPPCALITCTGHEVISTVSQFLTCRMKQGRVWHHFSKTIYNRTLDLGRNAFAPLDVEQWSVGRCRALDLERPLLSEGITANTK